MPGFTVAEEMEVLIPALLERLPAGPNLMFADVDLTNAPTFTTKEVATFFFQHSTGWLRWREGQQIREVKAEDGTISYEVRNRPPDPTDSTTKGVVRPSDPGWSRLFEIPVRDSQGTIIPPLNPSREGAHNGARRYSLADIELLAHRLRALNAVSTSRMLVTLNILLLIGYGCGVVLP